jgi:hypothetical protein
VSLDAELAKMAGTIRSLSALERKVLMNDALRDMAGPLAYLVGLGAAGDDLGEPKVVVPLLDAATTFFRSVCALIDGKDGEPAKSASIDDVTAAIGRVRP